MSSRLIVHLFSLLLTTATTLSALASTPADSIAAPVKFKDKKRESEKVDRHTLESHRYFLDIPIRPDSADLDLRNTRHFWRATGEVVGMNLGLWAFDRFVQKGEYAYISWSTIKNNFRNGFEWDDDYLPTNMFAHPYNGSLFYNAGRSNGFNFWQSSLFALSGSAMWELFMENEPPSTNDIIATPVAGTAIGEIFYRTSDLMIDDRAVGSERVGREVAAFIIDPMRGINRLITGEAWKRRSKSGRRFGIPPITAEISFGGRGLSNLNSGAHATRGGFVGRLFMEYGNPYEETTRKPYDYFTLLVELQKVKTQPPIGRIEITGRLLCTELFDRKDFNLNLGFYQHVDYLDSDSIRKDIAGQLLSCPIPYKLASPASLGAGVLFRYSPFPSMCLDGFTHVNAIPLAGILTDYYRNYHRSYNYASGFSIKSGANWTLVTDRLSMKLENRFYRLYTWRGYDQSADWSDLPWGEPTGYMGDKSRTSFNHLEAEFKCRMVRHWYVSLGLDLYTRRTKYLAYTFQPDQHTLSTGRVAASTGPHASAQGPVAPTSAAYVSSTAAYVSSTAAYVSSTAAYPIKNPFVTSAQIGFHLLLTYRF